MRRFGHYAISFFLIGAFACGRPRSASKAENRVAVKTVPILVTQEPLPIHTAGRVFPKTQINLSFKTGGLIRRFHVEEGEMVDRGQILAILDLAEMEAVFNQAKEGYEKAKRDLQRVENLEKDRAATLEMLQNAKTAYQVASDNLEIARFNLKYSRIEAPDRGRILKRLAEEGEIVGPGMPVVVFASSGNQWIMRSGVTDRDISRIRVGDKADVQVEVSSSSSIAAQVSEVAAAASPQTGTFEIELMLKTDDAGLKAGYFARAKIHTSQRKPYALIPVEALVEGNGLTGIVYILDRNERKARRKIISIHEIRDRHLAVTGLGETDEVITEGSTYVGEGTPVILFSSKIK